jgi:branched-chain amino acid transport system substrate-binding protein
MSRALQVSVFALFCATLFSCLSPGAQRDTGPVRIGIFADLSSTGARDGNDALKGAQLRVNEANAAGGIGGRTIQLVTRDIKQNPTEAVKAFTSLAQDEGVCAVIGAAVMNAGLAVSPVADLAKVPFVSLSIDERVTTPEWKTETPDVPGPVRQFSFLVQPSASQIALGIASYALDHFLVKRYATLYDSSNQLFSIQARAFEKAVKAAGRLLVSSQEMQQGNEAVPLAAIRAAGAEAIFVCGAADANADAARQAKAMGIAALLLGAQTWSAPLLDLAGDTANSAWLAAAFSPDDPALARLAPGFSAAYGEKPRVAALPGWESVELIIAAVQKAGSADPLKVRDALEQTSRFKGLVATWDMDRKTHRPVGLPVTIMRIASGAYVTAEQRYVPKGVKPAG